MTRVSCGLNKTDCHNHLSHLHRHFSNTMIYDRFWYFLKRILWPLQGFEKISIKSLIYSIHPRSTEVRRPAGRASERDFPHSHAPSQPLTHLLLFGCLLDGNRWLAVLLDEGSILRQLSRGVEKFLVSSFGRQPLSRRIAITMYWSIMYIVT